LEAKAVEELLAALAFSGTSGLLKKHHFSQQKIQNSIVFGRFFSEKDPIQCHHPRATLLSGRQIYSHIRGLCLHCQLFRSNVRFRMYD
jgi:hypothetical protein